MRVKATNMDVNIASIGRAAEFTGIRTGNLSPYHHSDEISFQTKLLF